MVAVSRFSGSRVGCQCGGHISSTLASVDGHVRCDRRCQRIDEAFWRKSVTKAKVTFVQSPCNHIGRRRQSHPRTATGELDNDHRLKGARLN